MRLNPNRRCADCTHGVRYLGCPSHRDRSEAMKLAIKEILSYKEADRHNQATNRLTKSDKIQMQGEIKTLRTKVEAAMHSKQGPQQSNTIAAQRTLEEIKEVQAKIQKDVARMAGIKDESLLKGMQDERRLIGSTRKEMENKTTQTETRHRAVSRSKRAASRRRDYFRLER